MAAAPQRHRVVSAARAVVALLVADLRQRLRTPRFWLLIAGLARDFQQLRLEFLGRNKGKDPRADVDAWLTAQAPRVAQFAALVDRARKAPAPNAAMLAQIAGQARVLLGR